mmetsp:Transcript_35718/g.34749  ORF Transcript_35718/g.34749 Transcript_35718/m.34749 type:complete len:229 (-) Transcript_35718:180-866(-)
MKESGYRALASLSYDSFCFIREHRAQFHKLSTKLSDLYLDEIEDNLGRDDLVNHKSSVNVVKVWDQYHFFSGASDSYLKFWYVPSPDFYTQDYAHDVDCIFSYKANYPILNIDILDENHLILHKYVNTLEIVQLSFAEEEKSQHKIDLNSIRSLSHYHNPYTKAMVSLSHCLLKEEVHICTAFEHGEIIIYLMDRKHLEKPMTQKFKIEFPDIIGISDMKILKIPSDF